MSEDAPLIALAAGGTGGHMFPAEALAQELKRRGVRVLLVTDARGRRYAENFPADERFEISAATPSIGGPVAKIAAGFSILSGLRTSIREFKKRGVVAAVGFGGYPSLPAMKAAAFMKIPYGVHEQNGVLGRANRMLANGAVFVAHGFPLLEKVPAKAQPRTIEVGNPVRDAVAEISGATFPALKEGGQINLLVFGGSQGASIFSKIAPSAMAELPADIRARLHVVHQAREGDLEEVAQLYSAAGIAVEVAPFFKDLPRRIASAHLVIARAGASSVTELSAIGRPSILVPLGIAMDDHQTGNARVLSEAGAALLMPECMFTKPKLAAGLANILGDNQQLKTMANHARGRVKDKAAARLADLALGLVDQSAQTEAA